MNCASIERQIGDLASGDGREREGADVTKHLRACNACAGLLERERNLIALFRDWSEPDVADTDRVSLRTSVRAAIEAGAVVPRSPAAAGRAAVAASIAAAALLLGIAGLGRLGGPANDTAMAGPATKAEDTEPGMFTMVGPFSAKERVEANRTSERSRRVASKPRGNVRRVTAPRKATLKPSPCIGAVDSDTMMRFEFQTEDPKIRIIWFVPKAEDPVSTTVEIGD